MKSFYGQYGRNKFPIYSRIRTDDNSVGGKILDDLGDALQTSIVDSKKNYKQKQALENLPVFEYSKVYKIDLFQNDKYREFLSKNLSAYNFFIKDLNDSDVSLTQVPFDVHTTIIPQDYNLEIQRENIQNTKIDLFETKESFFSLDQKRHLGEQGHHLWFYVPKSYEVTPGTKEIIDFKTQETTYGWSTNQREGNYFIIIRGIDIADNYKEEQIRITTDTIYRTKVKFKYICDLTKDIQRNITGGPAYEAIGFSTKVKCSIYPKYRDYISYDFYELVSAYSRKIYGAEVDVENDLFNFYSKMYLKLNRDEENNLDYLGYYFCGLSDITVAETSRFEENKTMVLMFEQRLDYDKETGEYITQIWPDYKLNLLVGFSNLCNLYYFKVGKNDFSAPLLPKTKTVTLELEAIAQHLKFNSEAKISIFNRNYGWEIDNIIIIRNKPSDRNLSNGSSFEFLQSDYTWSRKLYIHERDSRSLFLRKLEEIREESWLRSIDITSTLNEPGQWDFYVLNFSNENYNFKDKIKEFGLNNQNVNSATFYDFIIREVERNEYNVAQKDSIMNLNFDLNYLSLIVERTESSINNKLKTKFQNLLNVDNLQNINVNFYIDFVENNYIFYTEDKCIYGLPDNPWINSYSLNDRYLILYKEFSKLKINFTTNTYETGFFTYNVEPLLNFTSLDEIALRFNMFRERNESLNDFHTRVYKASQNTLAKDNYYFQKSLGFITRIQDKNIFEVKLIDPSKYFRLKISCAKLYIYQSVWNGLEELETILYEKELSEIKFLFDLHSFLLSCVDSDDASIFDIEVLQENDDWWYLKTRNLLQIDTKAFRNNFILNNAATKIPENKVKRLFTKDGRTYLENSNILDIPQDEKEYLYENDYVYKSSSVSQSAKYQFSMFPVTLKWLPFRWAAYNDNDFDYLTKDKCYYEDTLKKVPKILNQDGALLYNMVLKKHNHYWSEIKPQTDENS